MKILLFYTYNQSFLSSFFVQLATELGQKGYEVKIISLKKKPKTFIVPPSLTVEILKKKDKLSNLLTVFKTIKREKPDVVISNFSYVNPAILSGRLLGVKKNIVWFHTLSQQLSPNQLQVLIKSFFLKRASEIIVNSEYLKRDLEKNYSIPANRIFPIPFWSSLTQPQIRKEVMKLENFKIGCPGRIEEVKNQKLIIDIFSELDFDFQCNLYFAGRGSNREVLESKVKEKQLDDKIQFLGVLNIEDMKFFYKEMDIIVLPSKFEAFGLVLIEALSMGCAVLVSQNFGALTYIKDKDFLDRYTFDPNDPKDFMQKLKRIITNRNSTEEYFQNIYTSYFQKEKIVSQVQEVIAL